MEQSTTYLKNLKISPKKLRMIVDSIRPLKPVAALQQLSYVSKKSARIFYKAIKSAVTNAKQSLKQDENLLKFQALVVEEGQKLKRFKPGGRGGVKPIKRRFSHIKIVLVVEKKVEEVAKPKIEIKSKK